MSDDELSLLATRIMEWKKCGHLEFEEWRDKDRVFQCYVIQPEDEPTEPYWDPKHNLTQAFMLCEAIGKMGPGTKGDFRNYIYDQHPTQQDAFEWFLFTANKPAVLSEAALVVAKGMESREANE